MAKKELKVDVVVNAKTKELDKMFKKINATQTQLKRQSAAQNKVTSAVNRTNKSYQKQATLVDQLRTKVLRLANAYLGVMAAKAAVTTSDTITKAENKLNYLNDGDTAATQQQLDKMYASSQKVHMGYADMMSNVSKSMTLAGNAFGGNMDNAIRFQEIMSEAYTLSGSSAAEMSSSMYQMIQALGSGVLQGDELRSVREGASLAYQKIEEFAQGIYGADKNLKDLASDGKITSDIVVAAILKSGGEIDDAFAQTDKTFEQVWTNMKNTAVKSFEPVLQKLNDLLNSPVGEAIVNGIGGAIQVVAGIAMVLFNIIEKIFTYISVNWSWLYKALLSVGVVIASVLIPIFLKWLGTALAGLAASLAGAWANVVAFFALAKAEGLAATMAGLFGITINWALLIVIAVIAAVIIAVILLSDSFADACGNIVGVVFWLGATIWNILVGLVNAMVQFLWAMIDPFMGIIEWILNACNDGFNGVLGGLANFAGQIISIFLSLGKIITKIIDAVAGTNTTDWLNGLQDKVLAWGKKEGAITLNREAPDVVQRVSAQDAFASGYNYGEKFGTNMTNKFSGGGLATDEIVPNLEDISGNTGKMADSMELTEEDLAYLRKVANMEWKKEFTTASITVDMTNNNTVSNDFDLNSLAIGLRDLVEEEMYSVANGVYS